MILTSDRIEFLKKSHLFHGMNDEQLLPIAVALSEKEYAAQAVVLRQGSPSEDLFLIYSGKVRVEQQNESELQVLALLVAGDYFGAQELLTGRPRFNSCVAETKTMLLLMPLPVFVGLLKQMPRLKTIIEVDAHSHRLARLTHFDWLAEDEVIHFVARKHWAILVASLVTPTLTLGLASFLLIWGLLTRGTFPVVLGGLLLLLVLGWYVWNAIDWSNDYYIVTDKRVVWLEKVIGLYDSRQEAPLSTLLSVGVETDLIGRMLDYGTVVVRTFVGRIAFSHVPYPYEASHLISKYWDRTKEVSSIAEKEAMKNALREKMGLTVQVKAQEPPPKPPEVELPKRSAVFSLAKLVSGNLFRIRFEDSGTVTYRKHWYALLKQLWQPSAFILIVLIWLIYRGFDLLGSGTFIQHTADGRTLPDTILLSLLFVLLPLSLWWVYQFWDWRNDIFQVTPDQIVDIDKKPFGTEERRAALLDNILSTQYSRIGLAGYLFNFGTVYITVGGSQLAFEDVSDPASVQADIDRRREASLAKKREAEARRERERMADWLAAYHENAEEFDGPQEFFEDGKKTE